MAEEEEDKGFTVKDRRRFDESGNLRSEDEVAAKQEVAGEPEQSKEEEGFVMNEDAGQAHHSGEQVDFSSFVLSLATQALVQLGEMPPPPGMAIEKNVEGARQMIDLISMLSEKTKGNLTEPEMKLVEEMLHNLRLSYVKHTS